MKTIYQLITDSPIEQLGSEPEVVQAYINEYNVDIRDNTWISNIETTLDTLKTVAGVKCLYERFLQVTKKLDVYNEALELKILKKLYYLTKE